MPRFKQMNRPMNSYVRCPRKYGPSRSRHKITFDSAILAVVFLPCVREMTCTCIVPRLLTIFAMLHQIGIYLGREGANM